VAAVTVRSCRSRGFSALPGDAAFERLDGTLGVGILVRALHVSVDAIGVRPVGRHRDSAEALLLDQALRDHCSLAVELVGSVVASPMRTPRALPMSSTSSS
jgi:hypothetical protein